MYSSKRYINFDVLIQNSRNGGKGPIFKIFISKGKKNENYILVVSNNIGAILTMSKKMHWMDADALGRTSKMP